MKRKIFNALKTIFYIISFIPYMILIIILSITVAVVEGVMAFKNNFQLLEGIKAYLWIVYRDIKHKY